MSQYSIYILELHIHVMLEVRHKGSDGPSRT